MNEELLEYATIVLNGCKKFKRKIRLDKLREAKEMIYTSKEFTIAEKNDLWEYIGNRI